MIEQIPELEGLHVTPSKIESFLEHFGERCLLILDGLDEHALGSNQDVLKVLLHRKYLDCNILLTSRPYSTRQIQKDFDTVIHIEGFTQSEARKFACRIVQDEMKVEQILDFDPTGGKQEIVLCKCPILLSFMCILVREKAIDLSNKTMSTAEIYTRMMQCLYKKFTVRKGIRYDETEFVKVVGLVGKLAWKTLLSGKPLFERSRVEEEVGKDAFDYGFLIGNEDLIGDVKADILITFAHRSIQEFFGAFFFVLQLVEGKNIDHLICNEADSKIWSAGPNLYTHYLGIAESSQMGLTRQATKYVEPIFMVNPLFLHFCFWFLSDSFESGYFPVDKKKLASLVLYTYIRKKIPCRHLNLRQIVEKYSAIDIPASVHTEDGISVCHFGRIIEMFDTIQCLTLRYDNPVDWILDHIRSTLTLIVIEDESEKSKYNVFPELLQPKSNHLIIVLSDKAHRVGVLKCLLERAAKWEMQPIVHVFLNEEKSIDLSKILHPDMYGLNVIGTCRTPTKVTANNDFVSCPLLTCLSVTGYVELDESVILQIGKAIRKGKLSFLADLNGV